MHESTCFPVGVGEEQLDARSLACLNRDQEVRPNPPSDTGDELRVLFEKTDDGIASSAQQSAEPSRGMVVVHGQPALEPALGSIAEGAATTLLFEHSLVFPKRQTVDRFEAVPIGMLRSILAVFLVATRPALGVKTFSLVAYAAVELHKRLPYFATRTLLACGAVDDPLLLPITPRGRSLRLWRSGCSKAYLPCFAPPGVMHATPAPALRQTSATLYRACRTTLADWFAFQRIAVGLLSLPVGTAQSVRVQRARAIRNRANAGPLSAARGGSSTRRFSVAPLAVVVPLAQPEGHDRCGATSNCTPWPVRREQEVAVAQPAGVGDTFATLKRAGFVTAGVTISHVGPPTRIGQVPRRSNAVGTPPFYVQAPTGNAPVSYVREPSYSRAA